MATTMDYDGKRIATYWYFDVFPWEPSMYSLTFIRRRDIQWDLLQNIPISFFVVAIWTVSIQKFTYHERWTAFVGDHCFFVGLYVGRNGIYDVNLHLKYKCNWIIIRKMWKKLIWLDDWILFTFWAGPFHMENRMLIVHSHSSLRLSMTFLSPMQPNRALLSFLEWKWNIQRIEGQFVKNPAFLMVFSWKISKRCGCTWN